MSTPFNCQRLSGAEWVPRQENPYGYAPSDFGPVATPEPAVVSMRDLDRLVALKLADERGEAVERERLACLAAWEEGRTFGFKAGRRSAASAVDKVVRGRLNHTARHLTERNTREKTTIAAEREFAMQQALEVELAISSLRMEFEDTDA